MSSDVTSLLPPRGGVKITAPASGGDRSDADGRPGNLWSVLGPVGLVLALLVLATANSGAFDVREWAPPSLFLLIILLSIAVRGGGARLPDRWAGLTVGAAWAMAGWELLSGTWGNSMDAALGGAGHQL